MNLHFVLHYIVCAQTDILHKNDSSTFSKARQQNFTYLLIKVSNYATYLRETGPSRAVLVRGIQ